MRSPIKDDEVDVLIEIRDWHARAPARHLRTWPSWIRLPILTYTEHVGANEADVLKAILDKWCQLEDDDEERRERLSERFYGAVATLQAEGALRIYSGPYMYVDTDGFIGRETRGRILIVTLVGDRLLDQHAESIGSKTQIEQFWAIRAIEVSRETAAQSASTAKAALLVSIIAALVLFMGMVIDVIKYLWPATS